MGSGLTFIAESAKEDNRWIVESWPTRLETEYYRDPKVQAAEVDGTRAPGLRTATEHYAATGADPTHTHLSSWVESIRSRKESYENALVGRRAASCAHMVNLSAQTGRLVEWDFRREDIRS